MPADHSLYNQHNFQSTRGRSLAPYPSAKEAFRWSNSYSPTDDFSSLGLSDFFITHWWVACHWLNRLTLPSNTQELLAQGVQVGLECRKPYNPILEASISYTGATAVAIIDEVAFVNERQDKRMEGICEDLFLISSTTHSFSFLSPCTTTLWPEHVVKLLIMQPL